MTAICYIGIELSARTQQFLLGMEFVTLVIFAVVALVKVYANHPPHSIEPQAGWFNPFSVSSLNALRRRHPARGVRLLGVGLGGERQRGN